MKKLIISLLFLASSPLFADQMAENHMHDHSNMQSKLTPVQQAYIESMNNMHQGMSDSVKETDADRAFAVGMIAHHKGAIDMAKIELQYGKDKKMRTLAENIIKVQEKEIEDMQNWLDKNPTGQQNLIQHCCWGNQFQSGISDELKKIWETVLSE